MKEKISFFLARQLISVVLLIIFFIVTSLNDALWLSSIDEILFVTGVFILIYIILKKVIPLFNKNLAGMEILAFLLLFIILLLPKLHSNIYEVSNGKIKLSYLLGLFGFLFLIVIYQLNFKPKTSFTKLKNYIITVLALFILIEIFIIPGIFKDRSLLKTEILNFEKNKFDTQFKLTKKPNIYHIIFDAYTGFDGLDRYWQFRDTSFLNYLRTEKISFAYNAKTCNDNTLESITSLFNLKSFNNETKFRSLATKSHVYRKLIQKALVIETLMENGYTISNLSIFDIHDKKRYWDFPWLDPNISFPQYCFNQSLIGNLYKNYQSRNIANNNLLIISDLKQKVQVKKTSPLFTYAHLIMPHTPNNFDKDGNYIGNISNDKDAYIGELQYCNKIMIELIEMVKKDDPSAILILQSDHGSGMIPSNYDMEVSNILSLVVAPDSLQLEWPDSMINQNTYKHVFNALGQYAIPITSCQD